MPTLTDILDYEEGRMSWQDQIRFFQLLVDTGMAWQLQGHYGRTAAALIAAGKIRQSGKGTDE